MIEQDTTEVWRQQRLAGLRWAFDRESNGPRLTKLCDIAKLTNMTDSATPVASAFSVPSEPN